MEAGGVGAEDGPLSGGVEGRVAEALLELRGDGEGPEGLDLVLRGAVPDGVGAPQDALGADGGEELAEGVGGLVGAGEDGPPGGAELGVDVAAGADPDVLRRVRTKRSTPAPSGS